MKAEWRQTKLGEIIQLEYGKPLADGHRKPDGLYPVYGANGEKSRTDRFYHDKPSIVVGRKGSAGELNLTEPRFWPLDVTYFVTFDEQQHDLRFLYHLMATLELPRLAKGVKPGINRNEVYSQPARIPSLAEQQRVVAVLDEALKGLGTAKRNAEKNLQNARALFESRLQSTFDDFWRTGELVRLADLATDITDGDHLPPPKSTVGVPFITIGNIVKESRQIDFADTFMVSRAYFDALRPNKKPRRGDILYTVTGSFGIPVLLEEDREFCFQRHIGLIRPNPDTHSNWLYYLMLSPQVFRQSDAGAVGAAQRTVSLKVLRGFEVPKVEPARQQDAVRELDALAEHTQLLAVLYERKLDALDALKKSLLHQAFTGVL